MRSKNFISADGKFQLTLPSDWVEYEDGEENTYAFFNVGTWTGNLRVTPIEIDIKISSNHEKSGSGKMLENELTENKGAAKFKLGQFDCVHYRKDTKQDDEDLTMFYWIIRKGDRLLICSLTVDKPQADKPAYKDAVKEVQKIVESIKIT